MNWIITLYTALLFFVLVPGVLVNLPPKQGKMTTAAVHAVIFALIWHFTYKTVWQLSMNMSAPAPHVKQEGMAQKPKPKPNKM
jgi:hypothetical protein